MDRGDWQPAVHGVAKSQTQLSNRHCTTLAQCSTTLNVYGQRSLTRAPLGAKSILPALKGHLSL